ncbi:MAG TPA: hypothetical protein VFA06_18495 [Actinocrinis sp.]|jgi:hypothetical protein|uniref:hypothetical protein n=1 Tax=Actinocrinis sp. TaxID=1920516 RepID=UPI002D52A735|nr:hypothetical protein [Actinocrinis sp.]HZU57869.1 hypothetical protein [Actinocrinis sp.]
MPGTVLYDGKRSTTETCAAPQTTDAYRAPAETLHALHGLVAIANGPDYCLCGRTWPCEKRTD